MTGLIPSRGLCHAVFLLNRAAHLREVRTTAEWVQRARGQSTIMASALNLEHVAHLLLKVGLAKIDQVISLAPELDSLWNEADRSTFLAIASAILSAEPPNWIDVAVFGGALNVDYIPSDDLLALEWVGDDLADLLLAASRKRRERRDSEFALRLGEAAERVVVEAKSRAGGQVIHVAKIADFFGYDVEHRLPDRIDRIEVKGAVESTSGGFFITRNEVAQARRYGSEWMVVQVVFRSSIALAKCISTDDVSIVRLLTSEHLQSLVPPDTSSFSWVDSARISPPQNLWVHYPLLV